MLSFEALERFKVLNLLKLFWDEGGKWEKAVAAILTLLAILGNFEPMALSPAFSLLTLLDR